MRRNVRAVTDTVFLAGLAVTAASVYTARRLAVHKGRTPGPWGLAALLAGPVAVAVLMLMPSRAT